jgi:hypothetical protein
VDASAVASDAALEAALAALDAALEASPATDDAELAAVSGVAPQPARSATEALPTSIPRRVGSVVFELIRPPRTATAHGGSFVPDDMSSRWRNPAVVRPGCGQRRVERTVEVVVEGSSRRRGTLPVARLAVGWPVLVGVDTQLVTGCSDPPR